VVPKPSPAGGHAAGPGAAGHAPEPIENQEIVEYLRDRIASGRFRPLLDRRYPLEQIVEAYRYVETGQKIGNVAVTVAPPG